MEQDVQVWIIGAGISGLVAARRVQRTGLKTGVLEGRDRVGGRIWSIPDGNATLEAGPEFIHGRLGETVSLLQEYRIPFTATRGKMYYARNGRFSESPEYEADWDLLIRKMREIKNDLPFRQFLQQYFSEDQFRGLRESAIRFAEGFDLADISRASTISLAREWEQEEQEQYRIPGGYGQLTRALSEELKALGVPLLLNRRVTHLRWAENELLISSSDHEEFRGKKAIITLPVGVFHPLPGESGGLIFQPDIPDKRTALQQIGFGNVIKLVLRWKTPFWEAVIPGAQFILSDREIPTWWMRQEGGSYLLTGWAGGPVAERLGGFPERELTRLALANLEALFGMSRPALEAELIHARSFNWKNDAFSRGAYSFTLAGREAARQVWSAPVARTLYFAGEACYAGPYIGTVEAAIVSGLQAAGELMEQAGLVS
jgi:monoamine oxidase